jgi:hypothetical protein
MACDGREEEGAMASGAWKEALVADAGWRTSEG